MSSDVPFFTPRARYRFYGTPHTYLSAMRHAIESVAGRHEDYRIPLEARLAEMVGVRHAICAPQARFGLHLVFKHLLTPAKPKIVMAPYTIYDVVNMVLAAGGTPVFADIDPVTCNLDPDRMAELIDDRTGAVMITHLHGLACDVERITKICNARGVPVIEDAAQAFGARVGGRMVGGLGKAGVYSFGRAKNVNSFYGGAIVTDDDALAAAIRAEMEALPDEEPGKLAKRIAHCAVSDLVTTPPVFSPLTFRLFRLAAIRGIQSVNRIVLTEMDPHRREQVPEPYRRRLTSLQARILLDQLPDVEANAAIRLEHARIYHEGLSGQPGVQLPPWRDDGSHVYVQYPIQLDDRWDYVRYMMRHGRDLAIQHMASANEAEIFRDFYRPCPQAKVTADRVVILPTYPGYGPAEARKMVEVTRRYLGERAARAPGTAAEPVRLRA